MGTRETAAGVARAGRGAALFGAAGAALAGLASTASWPGVGTFFGAVEGAPVGAAVGVLAGLAVGHVSRRTGSAWPLRTVSGVIGGTCAVLGALFYGGPLSVSCPLAAILVAVAVLASMTLGPLLSIAAIPPRFSGPAGGPAAAPIDTPNGDTVVPGLGRFVGFGLAAGVMLGGAAGLIVGLRVYPPTAAFAAVEGGVLGAVSGAALGCLAAGICLFTRLGFRH